jgi:O-antigen ligase
MRFERALVWALVAVSLSAPFLIAGVHPWTQFSLSLAAVGLVGLLLAGRRPVPASALLLPAALATAFTALQILPLPAGLIHWVSPAAFDLRSATSSTSWMPLSVDVPATALALARASSCLAIMAVGLAVIRSQGRANRVLASVAIAGGVMAVLHVGQRLVGTERILGLYKPHSRSGSGSFGTFVAGNHAAAFFGLCSLISLGLALEYRDWRRGALLSVSALTAAILLSTGSRGGAVAFAIGLAVLGATLLLRRNGGKQALVVASIGVLSAGLFVLWNTHGMGNWLTRNGSDKLLSNQKVRGWSDGMALASHYPFTGVGRGAFEAPLEAYRTDDEGVRLVYPENAGVQMAAEWGYVVSFGIVILILLAAVKILPVALAGGPALVGATCGLLSVVVHEMADFSLELPGVAFPAAAVTAVVLARTRPRSSQREHAPSVPRIYLLLGAITAVIAVVASAWAASRTADAEWTRLTVGASEAQIAAAISRHPADSSFELLAAREALRRNDLSVAMQHLNRAMLLHPADARAHLLAARTLMRAGHVSQAALEFRLAGRAADLREVAKLTGPHAIEAVPQTPAAELDLAALLTSPYSPVADRACDRAIELSYEAEDSLAHCADLAVRTGNHARMIDLADRLLKKNPLPKNLMAAARSLDAAGERKRADDTMVAALRQHPKDAGLLFFAVNQRVAAGNLDGARKLLTVGSADAVVTLAERKASEELLAKIADQQGDVVGSTAARARAKLLARKLGEFGQGN